MGFEDIENLESPRGGENLESMGKLSGAELDYIQEVLPTKDAEMIADRIDEISGTVPPAAIDSIPEVSEMLEGIKEGIDPKYLEAPSDLEQVEKISDVMMDIEGCHYENWESMSVKERVDTLQTLENEVARIAHREPCEIDVKSLGSSTYGYYAQNSGVITINSDYLEGGDYESYKETLDTLIHEGRHAYQEYNLNERQVHSSPGDLTNWRINEFNVGYQSADTMGFNRYWMQPVEADARKFAEDVLTKFTKKEA